MFRKTAAEMHRSSSSTTVEYTAQSLHQHVDRWLMSILVLCIFGAGMLSLMAPTVPTRPPPAAAPPPSALPPPGGVAAMCCFDGPAWLQRRFATVVANVRSTIPEDWKVQIFHKNDAAYRRGMALNPGLARQPVVWTALTTTRTKRADVILSIELWQRLVSDTVLFFSPGGAFCANGPALATFLSEPVVAAENGGLLLVRRPLVLALLRSHDGFVPDKHNPLNWIATNLKGQSSQKDLFAAGDRYNTSLGVPFAIVSTLARLPSSDRNALLEQCPEAKVLFPALHDPSCFGPPSALDSTTCFASLCVSHPKASGC